MSRLHGLQTGLVLTSDLSAAPGHPILIPTRLEQSNAPDLHLQDPAGEVITSARRQRWALCLPKTDASRG